jgi:outer membrane lipoprotein-sorting protein
MKATFLLFFYLSTVLSSAALADESLPELLARMDRAAASFTGMTAGLKQVEHTEVLGENETQNAIVKLKRVNGGLSGRVDFAEPNRRIVGLRGRTVEVYVPKSDVVQIYDVGKFGQQFEQFLLLGFGLSGKELQRTYNVKLLGAVMVGSRRATYIEIVPKSKDALEYFKRAELWIAQGDSTYPVQEKIHKNGQDYLLITYSDVKLNAPLADKELELKLPAGVQKIYPNK